MRIATVITIFGFIGCIALVLAGFVLLGTLIFVGCGILSVVIDERRSFDLKPMWMSSRSIARWIPMFVLWPLCALIRLKIEWEIFNDAKRFTVGIGPSEEAYSTLELAVSRATEIAKGKTDAIEIWDRATKREYLVDAEGEVTDISVATWDKEKRDLLPDEVRRGLGL